MIADLRAESDRIGELTAESEKKLKVLRDETDHYKQLYADEVRKKIDDKALVESQRQVLSQVSKPNTARLMGKPSQQKRPIGLV